MLEQELQVVIQTILAAEITVQNAALGGDFLGGDLKVMLYAIGAPRAVEPQ